jgi:hypothetical protein
MLTACGSPAPECAADPIAGSALEAACACDAPSAEIGGGAYAFEPLAPGDPLVMVHGPQGGWHVLASLRLRSTLDIVDVAYAIDVLPDGPRVSDQAYRVQLVPDGACAGTYPGMYGYLDVSGLADGEADTPPELLGGRALRLTLAATDAEGRVATATLDGVAALDPIDVVDTGAAAR